MFSSMQRILQSIMSAISRLFAFLLNRRKPTPPPAYYRPPGNSEYTAPVGAKFVIVKG